MPPAIAGAIVAAIGVTGVAATIATAVLTVALSVGLNMLAMSLFGPARPKPSDGQQTVRQSVPSRMRHYGIVHTGGALSFIESTDGTLAQVVTLGTGHESEILEHRINDKPVTVVGGTVAEPSYHGAIHIYARPGADDQTAIAELTAKFPQWTEHHRQRGCAHAAIIADPVKQKYFSEVFAGQMPSYTQVRKAARLYDPRKDSTAGGSGSHRLNDKHSWEWSDNAALVIADYAAHPDGYGLGYDNVNWANIANEADVADQDVTAKTEEVIKRWRLWASYSMVRDERRQVMTDLLKACDGFTWQDADCKFNLKVGRFEEPTVTITDDYIIANSGSLGSDAQKRVSALKILYTEASIGYREQESATIGSVAGVDPNTDPQSADVYFAPHHNQAVRIGKLLFARLDDERWHLNPTLNLLGLNLLGERFCRVESQAAGISGYFSIEGLKLDLATHRVEATLSEVKPEDWDFDAATEEGTPPVAATSSSGPVTIGVPGGLSLSAVQIVLGETNGVAIEATWSVGREGLFYQVRFRPTSGGGAWQMMTVDQDDRTARSGPVDSGTQYEVQVRASAIFQYQSDWSPSATITPSASVTLSAPSDLAATGDVASAMVSFRLPTQSSFSYARLYRNTSSSFGGATQVGGDIVGALGEVITTNDTGLSAGTHYYWARAFKASGGSSALAGPVSAVVT